tara:strand:- start:2650 stop:3822 length:1173 start_codon:yes stop_codon:yes gene_type:complete
MALLRTRGGGLLATGPDAIRANAMRQQQQLLGAARAPSVIRAPTNVIMEENPLNTLGPGLGSLGKSLGQMALQSREQQAREAAQAAGNNPEALMAVQRQFPNTAAGKTAGTLAARLTGDKLRRDRFAFEKERSDADLTLRRESAAAAAAQRAIENRRADDRAGQEAADRKMRRDTLARERQLRKDIAAALKANDMRKVAALQMMSSEPSIMQAGAQLAKTLGEPPNPKKPFDGNYRAGRDELDDVTQIRELSSLNERLAEVTDDIASGDLEFGLIEDSFNFIRNFTGFTLGERGARKVIARNRYERFIQKYVNDSLRLNKGVQTEGDAMRAIRELRAARDVRAVQASLASLEAINNRAQEIREARVQDRRALYGMQPFDFGDNVSFKEVD